MKNIYFLKKQAEKDRIRISAKSITLLEDDIDLPIKKCVAMFALLGCEPVYSCCGFDYEGQPLHKSHQYGRPYFVLIVNSVTLTFLDFISKQKILWFAQKGNHPKWVNLELMCGMNPHWRREECIHFYEECLIGINVLENILYRQKPIMSENCTLIDTNYLAKKSARHWQYPPKEPWIVQKSLLDSY